jgi:carbonic anhydrase
MMGAPLSGESVTPASEGVAVREQPGPAEALAALLAGNERFAAGRPRYGHHVTSPAARTEEHRPWALVIGCLDSRVPPEAVLDQDFGSIVVVRTGGHALDTVVLGSVEFAVGIFEVPLVLVLGHQYCGAVAATVQAVGTGTRPDGALGGLVDEIAPAVRETAGAGAAGHVDRTVDRHVTRTIARLSELPLVRERLMVGTVDIVGARYQIDTGKVTVLGRGGHPE